MNGTRILTWQQVLNVTSLRKLQKFPHMEQSKQVRTLNSCHMENPNPDPNWIFIRISHTGCVFSPHQFLFTGRGHCNTLQFLQLTLRFPGLCSSCTIIVELYFLFTSSAQMCVSSSQVCWLDERHPIKTGTFYRPYHSASQVLTII